MATLDLVSGGRFDFGIGAGWNAEEMEEIVTAWYAANDFDHVSKLLSEGGVAFSLVFTAKDAFEDPHFAARENIVPVEDSELGTIRMQGIVPKLRDAPGAVRRAGPSLGEHNEQVYADLLGLDAAALAALREKGVV